MNCASVFRTMYIFFTSFYVSGYLLNCKVIWVVVVKRSAGLCMVFICR